MLLSRFATIATTNAFADGIVARVALLTALNLLCSFYCNCYVAIANATSSFVAIATTTAFKLICSCYCNCYAAIGTLTSSFLAIATTNALLLLRVPGQTATLPLLLLTSFASVATAFAFADASVARVHYGQRLNCCAAATVTAMLPLLLQRRV